MLHPNLDMRVNASGINHLVLVEIQGSTIFLLSEVKFSLDRGTSGGPSHRMNDSIGRLIAAQHVFSPLMWPIVPMGATLSA